MGDEEGLEHVRPLWPGTDTGATCQNSESLIVLSYMNESTSKRLSISNHSWQQLSMLLSDVKQCSQLEMDSRDSWKEFVSV